MRFLSQKHPAKTKNGCLPVYNNVFHQSCDFGAYSEPWNSEYLRTCALSTCFTMFGSAAGFIIDNGATSSVCGLSWIREISDKPLNLPDGKEELSSLETLGVSRAKGSDIIYVGINEPKQCGEVPTSAYQGGLQQYRHSLVSTSIIVKSHGANICCTFQFAQAPRRVIGTSTSQ